MKKLLEKLLTLFESSIDFPQKDLDLSVWDKEDDTYKIKPEVKDRIFDVLGKYPETHLLEVAKEIHIVGSSATNQYTDDADIDVHIIPEHIDEWTEESQNKVIEWFNEHRDEIDGYIEEHPIEVYIQLDPDQDLMSDGCYDLMTDEWLTGPKIVSLDYDPYEDFSGIADDLRNAVEDADKLFGELKRDVIDFDVIKAAMEQLSPEQKGLFLKRLKSKLEEIEEDIKALYAKRKEWVDARRTASKPSSPEQALKDVELAKRWKDENALFKFVNRYKYLKMIKALEELLADDEISPDEVDTIKGIVGV